jgi:hypothetical protein
VYSYLYIALGRGTLRPMNGHPVAAEAEYAHKQCAQQMATCGGYAGVLRRPAYASSASPTPGSEPHKQAREQGWHAVHGTYCRTVADDRPTNN